GFVARVVDRTTGSAAAKSAWWKELLEMLLAPRQLQWNLASAAALTCVALVALASVVGGRLSLTGRDGPAAMSSTVLVRLVVLQPSATTVQVAGDFNGWNPAHTSLEQTSNGAWSV